MGEVSCSYLQAFAPSNFRQENEGENEDLDERVARANDDEEIRSGNRARESGVDSPGPDLDRGHREHSSSFSVSGSGAFPGQELTSAENGLAQAGVAIKHADEEDQAEQDTEGTELDKDGLPSAPDQLLVSSGEEAYEKGIKDEVDLDDDQPAQERDSAQPGKGSLGDAAPEDNDEDIPETNDMHPGRGSLLSGEKMGIGESNIIGNQANGLRGSQTSSKTIGFDSFDNPKEEASKKGGGFAEDAAVGLKPAADSIGTDTMEETKRTKLRGNGFTKERTADGLSPKSGSIPKATTEKVKLGIGGSKDEKLSDNLRRKSGSSQKTGAEGKKVGPELGIGGSKEERTSDNLGQKSGRVPATDSADTGSTADAVTDVKHGAGQVDDAEEEVDAPRIGAGPPQKAVTDKLKEKPGAEDSVEQEEDDAEDPVKEGDKMRPKSGSLPSTNPATAIKQPVDQDVDDVEEQETGEIQPAAGSLHSTKSPAPNSQRSTKDLRGQEPSSSPKIDAAASIKNEGDQLEDELEEQHKEKLQPAKDSLGSIKAASSNKQGTADGLSPKSGSIPKATTAQGVEQVQLGIGGSKNEKLSDNLRLKSGSSQKTGAEGKKEGQKLVIGGSKEERTSDNLGQKSGRVPATDSADSGSTADAVTDVKHGAGQVDDAEEEVDAPRIGAGPPQKAVTDKLKEKPGAEDAVEQEEDDAEDPVKEGDKMRPKSGSLPSTNPATAIKQPVDQDVDDVEEQEAGEMQPATGSLVSKSERSTKDLSGEEPSSSPKIDAATSIKNEGDQLEDELEEQHKEKLQPAKDSLGSIKAASSNKQGTADGLSPKSGSIPKATTAQGVEQVQLGIGGSKNEKLSDNLRLKSGSSQKTGAEGKKEGLELGIGGSKEERPSDNLGQKSGRVPATDSADSGSTADAVTDVKHGAGQVDDAEEEVDAPRIGAGPPQKAVTDKLKEKPGAEDAVEQEEGDAEDPVKEGDKMRPKSGTLPSTNSGTAIMQPVDQDVDDVEEEQETGEVQPATGSLHSTKSPVSKSQRSTKDLSGQEPSSSPTIDAAASTKNEGDQLEDELEEQQKEKLQPAKDSLGSINAASSNKQGTADGLSLKSGSIPKATTAQGVEHLQLGIGGSKNEKLSDNLRLKSGSSQKTGAEGKKEGLELGIGGSKEERPSDNLGQKSGRVPATDSADSGSTADAVTDVKHGAGQVDDAEEEVDAPRIGAGPPQKAVTDKLKEKPGAEDSVEQEEDDAEDPVKEGDKVRPKSGSLSSTNPPTTIKLPVEQEVDEVDGQEEEQPPIDSPSDSTKGLSIRPRNDVAAQDVAERSLGAPEHSNNAEST